MTTGQTAERRALLELESLLEHVQRLRDAGDALRFSRDDQYRWILHRLWIAVGNEAFAYAGARGMTVRQTPLWANLYDLRNHLAHSRLPDIDEGLVQRFTWSRTDSILEAARALLRPNA